MSGFIPNELVWVKLGGVQWPAVVKDKADCEEFLEALRRDPIVVVEFFDKKLHDVYNKNQIYRYNCEEKEDIMLKSLQLTKNKPDISENFKKDIITAEKLTDGDIHILSKGKFTLSGRQKYDELFSSAKKSLSRPNVKRKPPKPDESPQKSKTSKYADIFPENSSKNRRSASKPKKATKSLPENPRLNITHPRFIAENDHKIRILAPASAEARTPAPSGSDPYRCVQCSFTTARLNVLILHNKTHVAAAAVKTPTGKRKNAEPGDAAKKPRKKPAVSEGASPRSGKTMQASGSPKKAPGGASGSGGPVAAPQKKAEPTPTADKPRTPVKISPLKPSHSSKPLLLEDWDEDDDEEAAERLKIQSEIDKFISDKERCVRTDEDGEPTVDSVPTVDSEPTVDSKPSVPQTVKEEGATCWSAAVDAPKTEAASEAPHAQDESAVAVKQGQQQRNDALLQAAVDDVLADTAPAALPALPAGPLSGFDFSEPADEATLPRSRPVRVCPAGSPPRRAEPDDVTSSRPGAAASSTADAPTPAALPPNLQILSVPGADGQPDTYVLVSVDDKGNVQTVNPLDNLGGLGADTLLAYEVVQEDGSTRTAYLNPAALSTSADIKHLLGGEGRVDSTTPVPDSSGK